MGKIFIFVGAKARRGGFRLQLQAKQEGPVFVFLCLCEVLVKLLPFCFFIHFGKNNFPLLIYFLLWNKKFGVTLWSKK